MENIKWLDVKTQVFLLVVSTSKYQKKAFLFSRKKKTLINIDLIYSMVTYVKKLII